MSIYVTHRTSSPTLTLSCHQIREFPLQFNLDISYPILIIPDPSILSTEELAVVQFRLDLL